MRFSLKQLFVFTLWVATCLACYLVGTRESNEYLFNAFQAGCQEGWKLGLEDGKREAWNTRRLPFTRQRFSDYAWYTSDPLEERRPLKAPRPRMDYEFSSPQALIDHLIKEYELNIQ